MDSERMKNKNQKKSQKLWLKKLLFQDFKMMQITKVLIQLIKRDFKKDVQNSIEPPNKKVKTKVQNKKLIILPVWL